MKKLLLILLFFSPFTFHLSPCQPQLALLRYGGGGDWYANPTSLRNLTAFCNQDQQMGLVAEPATVDVGSAELFNYPFVHMTGHGNVVFTEAEVQNLRRYLTGGGFLHIDDNYGLRQYVMPQMQRVFPELEWVELPFSHPIYHRKYDFPNGLPKVHEHDNLPPKGYALVWQGRVVCFFSWECDLGDGWEDPDVHGDSQATRLRALRMGSNLVSYAFGE